MALGTALVRGFRADDPDIFWWTLAKNPEGELSFGSFLPIMRSIVTLALSLGPLAWLFRTI